jgi:heme/copper-type cytochrome/quinol oxidase subunit 1
MALRQYIVVRPGRNIAAQNLLHGWLLFAVGCAGIAGLLSGIVAGARIPAVGWLLPNASMFYIGMVGHVAFGLVIWLLAFVIALTVYFAVRERMTYDTRAAQWGLAAAMLGAGIVFGSVLNGQGTPFLTDYVPVLETPTYFIGFALFAVGALIALANYLPAALRHRQEISLPAFGMMAPTLCGLIAAAALICALIILAPRSIVEGWRYQSLFWGAGHTLQYVYAATMAVAWYALANAAFGALPIKSDWARTFFLLYPLLALTAPLAYFVFDPSYSANLRVPGILLDEGLSVPTILHFALIVWAIVQARRKRALPPLGAALRKPEGAALVISMGLYLVGAALEPRAALGTTRVPAHYHGMVVGGVTTALMGLGYHLLRQMDWQIVREKIARAQLYLFGVGVLISILGLAWAGSLGAPRKTFDAGLGTPYTTSMNFMGIGAGLAALGGAIFVGSVLVALMQWRRAPRVSSPIPVITQQ